MHSSQSDDGGWRRGWIVWRNRLLSSPHFQRFAARFPLTRPLARRHARELFDLVAGFTYSQILLACVETRLIEHLAEEPRTAGALARQIGLPVEATERLLRAAAAVRLVERAGDRWMPGVKGAALLANPGIAEMVRHHRALYADLAEPVALLARGGGGGALSNMWRYAESPGTGAAAEVAPYSALMAASQPMVAREAIAARDFRRHRRMLDVGGGEGAFIGAVAAAAPALHFGLFDLPAVVDRAEERLAAAGLAGRVEFHRGNFLTDPIPPGYDLLSLVRVLHDHDDDAARQLLRRACAALERGGQLLVVEPMAGTPGAEAMGDAYFGLYLLAMGSGRPRTAAEIRTMLIDAGFRRVRERPTDQPLIARMLVATA